MPVSRMNPGRRELLRAAALMAAGSIAGSLPFARGDERAGSGAAAKGNAGADQVTGDAGADQVAGNAVADQVAGGAPGESQPVIDAHIHFWDQKTLNPPWLSTAQEVLQKRFMGEEYRQATKGLNVERAVYVEIAESNERRPAEAQFIVDLIRGGTTPIGAVVIGGDPALPGFAAYIKRFSQAPEVKGVRCFYRKGCESDRAFVAGIRKLGELNLSFDLVLGWSLLEGAVQLVRDCPQTFFILDHCAYGNPDWFDPESAGDAKMKEARDAWERGVAGMAKEKNVVCKISGVPEYGQRPPTTKRVAAVVEFCLREFGEDRVLFGSDWPVCLKAISLAKWVEMLKEIVAPRGPMFAKKLFRDNAMKHYRIEQRA